MPPLEEQLRDLRQQRAALIEDADALYNEAEAEERELTDEEQRQIDEWMDEVDDLDENIRSLQQRIERRQRVAQARQELATTQGRQTRTAPAVIRERGDSEARAIANFIRTGDASGLQRANELRASNDTDMNIGTNADGGYAVPTGHFNGIIARRDESMLANRLGVREIPGVGTTVNVPVDDEDDGEFVSTNEGVDHDRDAPALNQVAMTLVRYTKKIQLSWELLEDEQSRLLAFLEDFVGRGMAKTHNDLLLTEVAANGATLNTFASATAIAVDELEPIVYDDDLGAYLDDTGSVSWVMKRSVHGEIVLLDDANERRYSPNALGDPSGPTLLGFPVAYSQKAGNTEASAKSVYFGNWNFVGKREGGIMTFLRDPYSYEAGIELRYQFRAVYKVLQDEAIGFGEHPSS